MKLYLIALITGLAIAAGCTSDGSRSTRIIKGSAGTDIHLPYLASDTSGHIFLSWVETDRTDNISSLQYAQLEGTDWSKPQTIAASDEWFINWADYPTIVAENGAVTAAHALRKIPGNTYSYNVNIFLRDKSGSWTQPLTPHFDSTATEHGFVSMIPWKQNLLAVWLDGRRTENRTEREYFDIKKAMTLRSAIITPRGTVIRPQSIDQTVCDCCNTSLAMTPKGPIVAYRNRTENEIRDIYVSRFAGDAWTKPATVASEGWRIGACPVNGPAIAAHDSMVVVAWYTGAGNIKQVKAARSANFGKTFSSPVVIQKTNAVGRIDLELAGNGIAYVSWMSRKQDHANLNIMAIHEDGSTERPQTIAKMSLQRQSGFPQLELQGTHLILAWTKTDSTGTAIMTTKMPTSKLVF